MSVTMSLPSTSYGQGTVLGTGKIGMNKTDKISWPCGTYVPVRETENIPINKTYTINENNVSGKEKRVLQELNL